MKEKWTEDKAIAALSKNGISVGETNFGRMKITLPKQTEPRKRYVGLKLWGAIDFLRNEYEYIIIKD